MIKPCSTDGSVYSWGTSSQWCYGDILEGNVTYVYFENGVVTDWNKYK